MTAARVLVWGARGHGRVVADLVSELGLEICGFVDANEATVSASLIGTLPLFAEAELQESVRRDMLPAGATAVALGIGDNHARLVRAIALGPFCAPPFVHPRAHVSQRARLSAGAVVLAGAVVNAGAEIGRAVIVNSAAVVEHDCRLGDGVHVSPGAVLAGNVTIGVRTWVGANATVIQGLAVGCDATVGAGSVVIRAVPDGVTVAGVPARLLTDRQRPEQGA